jgi:hypothetical protein
MLKMQTMFKRGSTGSKAINDLLKPSSTQIVVLTSLPAPVYTVKFHKHSVLDSHTFVSYYAKL